MNQPARRSSGQARDWLNRSAGLERAKQFAQSVLTFPADQKIDFGTRLVRRWREAWIVTSCDNSCRRSKMPNDPRDRESGFSLKRHDRQPDDVGLVLAHQTLDGGDDPGLDQDEVGNRNPVMRIDVAGEGREGPVRHPDYDRRHVLEGVRLEAAAVMSASQSCSPSS